MASMTAKQPRPQDPMPLPGAYIEPGRTPPEPRDSRATALHAGRLALFALAVIGGLCGLWVLWMHLLSDPLGDVRAYYDAATRLNQGSPLYPAGADPNAADFFRYPPLLAIVLRPLALLPYTWFALAWEALMLGAFVATIRHLGGGRRTWIAVGLLGIPIGWAIGIGQAQILVTYLMAVGQPWSIALGGQLKLFPILIAIWWLGRRDWQAVGAVDCLDPDPRPGPVRPRAHRLQGIPRDPGPRPGGPGPEHQPVCDLTVPLGGPRRRRCRRRGPPGADALGLAGRRRALDAHLAAPARVHADEPDRRRPRARPARGRGRGTDRVPDAAEALVRSFR